MRRAEYKIIMLDQRGATLSEGTPFSTRTVPEAERRLVAAWDEREDDRAYEAQLYTRTDEGYEAFVSGVGVDS